MNRVEYILLLIAAVAVRTGYAALVGSPAPGVTVYWQAMIGPFVIAAITFALLQLILFRRASGVAKAARIYAVVVAIVGVFVAAALFMGKSDGGQNHSDYAYLFGALWFIAVPPAPVLIVVALAKRFIPKRPNSLNGTGVKRG